MKYVLRIKAVSECAGIRRAALAYAQYGNGVIDLTNEAHPLNAFDHIEIDGDEVKVLDEVEKLQIQEEAWLSFGRKVTSSSGDIIERIDLRLLVIPLLEETIPYYQKAIEDKLVYDAWDGEFEYLIGLIYELELNNLFEASKYYFEAQKKRFNYKIIRKTM